MTTPIDSIVRPIQPKLISPAFVRDWWFTNWSISASTGSSRGNSGRETVVAAAAGGEVPAAAEDCAGAGAAWGIPGRGGPVRV
jgi:hypothetical protein